VKLKRRPRIDGNTGRRVSMRGYEGQWHGWNRARGFRELDLLLCFLRTCGLIGTERRDRYGVEIAGAAQEAGKILELTRTIILFVDAAMRTVRKAS
jgi:hypothetical protein